MNIIFFIQYTKINFLYFIHSSHADMTQNSTCGYVDSVKNNFPEFPMDSVTNRILRVSI